MGLHAATGAMMMCSFGVAPSTLNILPVNRTFTSKVPAANIMDHVPFMNIMPFGMCITPSNPMVAAATAAALGVLTPMPCIPVTAAPWIVGSPTVLLGSVPALNNTSTLMCMWGGVITIMLPGQFTEMIP
ncbi:DUF4280 domain-containing protein [Ignavibacteria bacterium]|nr:DUF4280 domain-containing protein [Bacteroidota bacterium]MCZ2131830.1 DUF4280 domain-containing protein [Bacteroidota bacterium]